MHILIVGQTGTGKSSLIKQIIAVNAGRKKVAVCAPFNEYDSFSGVKYFDKIEDFIEYCKKEKNVLGVVDEAGTMLGQYAGENIEVATLLRHYGCRIIFGVQRLALLDNSIRAQCTNFFVFRLNKKDCEIIDNEATADGHFLDCYKIEKGKCKYLTDKDKKGLFNVWND